MYHWKLVLNVCVYLPLQSVYDGIETEAGGILLTDYKQSKIISAKDHSRALSHP